MRISDWSSDVCSSDLQRSAARASSTGTRLAHSLAIATVLLRPLAPATTNSADFGTPSALASSPITAVLALPSSGGAVTATFSAGHDRNSGVEGNSVSVRLHLGVRRTIKKKKTN